MSAAPLRHLEHGAGGIQPAQPTGVTGFPGPVQQRARAAADVEHGPRCHDQREVEVEVASSLPRVEHVVQSGQLGIGERPIHHDDGVPGHSGDRKNLG